MFNPTAFDNSRPDGVAVLEILSREVDRPRTFVPLKRTAVGGEVIGPLAAMQITHVYGFSRPQSTRVVEALYRFPLPGDAAVTGVVVTFGDVEIRAELKERSKAHEEYERAKREGRQGALVTRESPDVFTLRVTGIQPDEDVTVETSYVQLANPEGEGWTLRVPLTTAPRYVRSDEAGTPQAEGQPMALLRDPGHLFSIDLLMPGADLIESPTHETEISDEDGRPRVRLAGRQVVPDRDFVLRWKAEQRSDGAALRVLTHEDPVAGHLYFLAMVAPPASSDASRRVPREVTLLVDHSGSMQGPKWEAADWAVKKFLAGLDAKDAFALGLFHTRTHWYARGLRGADPSAVAEATGFLEKHKDSGGTELGVALEQALSIETGEGEAARHVLIITDAEVSDEGRILRLADEESRAGVRRRISVLCIDSAPNAYLARELALRGGGVARFLTSDPKEGDITTALDQVLMDWEQPVLAGLGLEVEGGSIEAAGRRMLASGAVDLGDLPRGRAVWVAGRTDLGDRRSRKFRLLSRDEEMGSATGEAAGGMGGCPAIKALFGVWRVNALEHLVASGRSGPEVAEALERLGYDPGKVLPEGLGSKRRVYHENVRADLKKALEGLLVRESLSFGVLTSVTGFVATRLEKGKPVEETMVVANALPHGWSEESFGAQSFRAAGLFASFAPSAPPRPSPSMPRMMARDAGGFPAEASAADLSTPASLRRHPADVESRRDAGLGEWREPLRFSGVPGFQGDKAVLAEVTAPEGRVFRRLRFRFLRSDDHAERLDSVILVFGEDGYSPAVSVRLGDLLAQSGERPVNLFVPAGASIRIVVSSRRPEAWVGDESVIEVVLE